MQSGVWTFVALAIGLPLAVCGQGASSAVTGPEPVKDTLIAAPAGIPMRLDVVVSDRSGKPVAGLSAEDFALFDNGRPRRLLSFGANRGDATLRSPAQVILLIDTMNARFADVSYETRQVEKYLRQNGGRLAYPTSVDWVTEEGVKAQVTPMLDGNAMADKLEMMEAAVHSIVAAQGIYGALDLFQRSIRVLDAVALDEAQRPGHKLAIWIGPGWPMLGGPTFDLTEKTHQTLFRDIVAMSDRLDKAHLSLYSVSLGQADRSTFMYTEWLKGVRKVDDASGASLSENVLAVQSGGVAQPPTNDVAEAIDECVQDAEVFYTLTFEAAETDQPYEYHELKLQLDKKGLKARSKTGYYARSRQQPAP